ncbi:MAG: bifunctional diaminohydroxyphosphoribosylaminopyrimidine deaminase/5-amino-6-(5-phosphoribosylamino)uracil reductase RibD [Pseudomonadota bacterium]
MNTSAAQTEPCPGDHERFMAACLRLAMRHDGLTGTNPSVGTLLVKDGVVVGKGITARGGRPHAERIALDMAEDQARGATAYVSLEPCAHHGVTPPCAQALIDAGVAEVFTAWTDPDNRVDGKGHAMLRAAGISVHTGLCADQARRNLLGYLTRKSAGRPTVTLKLAVSRDGKLGRQGEEIAITGPLAKAMVHRLRGGHNAILVGRGTVEADDPDLTSRLPGLEGRSPHRFVLDAHASLSPTSRLAQTARNVPVTLVSAVPALPMELTDLGVRHGACEQHDGQIALPELLDDMAAQGITTLMVEGGATVAKSFLELGLVDRIALFQSPHPLLNGQAMGGQGAAIDSPLTQAHLNDGFDLDESLSLGADTARFYVKR